jgi:Arc/MetJ-type ribon-helix-helix transcriptional regulator
VATLSLPNSSGDTGYSTIRVLNRVSQPIPTRFSDDEIRTIDRLVALGLGDSRSAVIRRAIDHLDETVRRARVGESIADSYRTNPQGANDDALAMASALAITDAEPW